MDIESRTIDTANGTASAIEEIISRALREDIGAGDLTAQATIPDDLLARAVVIAKQEGIIAGLDVMEKTFCTFDSSTRVTLHVQDGTRVEAETILAEIRGSARSIVTAERVALNFLQRMSGIATLTSKFAERVRGTKAKILDTRKTAPGLRVLDKQAVRLGGGYNHRAGLFDMILIKENHIVAAGGIQHALNQARTKYPNVEIVIEVKTLSELAEALWCKPDRVLLDNMDLETIRTAVNQTHGTVALEASGNITLENVREVALTGVDFISIGALTHSVHALDISLLLQINS